MIPDALKALAAGAVAFLWLSSIDSALAHQVNCEMVRDQVRTHGKIKAYAWAISQGYSPRDIARIRKQCNV